MRFNANAGNSQAPASERSIENNINRRSHATWITTSVFSMAISACMSFPLHPPNRLPTILVMSSDGFGLSTTIITEQLVYSLCNGFSLVVNFRVGSQGARLHEMLTVQ